MNEILPDRNLIDDIRKTIFNDKKSITRLRIELVPTEKSESIIRKREKLKYVEIIPKNVEYYIVDGSSKLDYFSPNWYDSPDNYIYLNKNWAINKIIHYGGKLYRSSQDTDYKYVRDNRYDYITKIKNFDIRYNIRLIDMLFDSGDNVYLICSNEKYEKSNITVSSLRPNLPRKSKKPLNEVHYNITKDLEEATLISMATGGRIIHLANSC